MLSLIRRQIWVGGWPDYFKRQGYNVVREIEQKDITDDSGYYRYLILDDGNIIALKDLDGYIYSTIKIDLLSPDYKLIKEVGYTSA